MLNEGIRIDFNLVGGWTDVDASVGKTIPSGFYPEAIDAYIATNFQGAGINEISKETYRYDVDLVTGTDLCFSYEGAFISYDTAGCGFCYICEFGTQSINVGTLIQK